MEWVAGHGATEERQTRVLSGFPSVSLRVFGYRLLPCPVWCRHLRTPPRDGHVPQKSAATCAPDACAARAPEPSLRLAPAPHLPALVAFSLPPYPSCPLFWTNWPDGAGSLSALQTLILPQTGLTGLGNWWETWLILEYWEIG